MREPCPASTSGSRAGNARASTSGSRAGDARASTSGSGAGDARAFTSDSWTSTSKSSFSPCPEERGAWKLCATSRDCGDTDSNSDSDSDSDSDNDSEDQGTYTKEFESFSKKKRWVCKESDEEYLPKKKALRAKYMQETDNSFVGNSKSPGSQTNTRMQDECHAGRCCWQAR